MPKQSRVKKQPMRKIDDLMTGVFERLCKLETAAVNAEDLADGQQIFESRILHKFNELDERQLKYVDAQIHQLNARMGSDFQDQDDEIEKISRRLQSVEDKLKAKELATQTNVDLTARVKELQRQLTAANDEIDRLARSSETSVRVVDTVQLQCGRIVDSDYVEELKEYAKTQEARADRLQRELNDAGIENARLLFEVEKATRPDPNRLFRRLFSK